MKPDQLAEVWEMLDREQLANIARSGPAPVFASISGAHLYGFASPDSDVDLRGAFLLPVRAFLGLHPPRETVEISDDSEIDLDWVAHDLRKFVRMLTNHNGYVLEQLYSPLVVVSTPAHEELKELGHGCVTRPTARHYRGFARGRLKRLAEPEPTVKHLLYAYRVLFTGIHMMRTAEVVANLQVLNEEFHSPVVDELIGRKRAGAEHMLLETAELADHVARLGRLDEELDRSHERSRLPEEPTGVAALEDFVIRARLAAEAG